MTIRRISSAHLLAGGLWAVLLATSACDGAQSGTGVIAPTDRQNCEKQSDCTEEGFICKGGICRPGECVAALQDQCGPGADPVEVEPYCCAAWQVCSDVANECVPNPDAPIGNQCVESVDCPGIGEFCSGGTCYDPAGHDVCTASFQCPADERCDLTVDLCVPDKGGCNFCDSFPELCCEEGFLCDTETSFCEPIGEAECTTVEDCRSNELCDDFGRCVQCITDDDCGPGTTCNPATGSCRSASNACEGPDDCPFPKQCATALDECVTPQCLDDDDCTDPRDVCDLTVFKCLLPPATCPETDEPNDTIGTASAATSGYAATLCRGNTDHLSFAVLPDKRYQIKVDFADYTAGGNSVTVLSQSGSLIVSEAVNPALTFVTVEFVTAEDLTDTTHYLRIVGDSTSADLWPYTVEIIEEDAPDQLTCAQEVAQNIEPNDDFATATEIGPGLTGFARCTSDDLDFYKIVVPPQNGIEVTVTFDNDLGDMALKLYDAPDANSEVDSSDGWGADVETVSAAEGPTTFYLRVSLYSLIGTGTDGQPYSINVTLVPRPQTCLDNDINEPGDDAFATAGGLEPNTPVTALRCVPSDVDYFTFTLADSEGGGVGIDFDHTQGDLRLDLYDDTETLIDSSNTSTSTDGTESIEIPFAAGARTFTARVRLNGTSGDVGQPYTIYASAYDATQCLLSEATPNDTLLLGQCIGTFATDFPCEGQIHTSLFPGPALATCQSTTVDVSGCGTACGASDQDWYRVGTLNDGQLLRARLEYDPGPVENPNGRLGLMLVRANYNMTGTTTVAFDNNVNNDGVIEIATNAPTVAPAFAREYAVVVVPQGTAGFNALPYALEVEVGAACAVDSEEPNEVSGQSALIRPGATAGVAYTEDFNRSRCAFDTDVYELIGFTNETITATVVGPAGLTVDIGTRPADYADLPDTFTPGGAGIDPGAGCVLPVGPQQGCVQAQITNPAAQQIFVTVGAADDLSSIGDYTLRVTATP